MSDSGIGNIIFAVFLTPFIFLPHAFLLITSTDPDRHFYSLLFITRMQIYQINAIDISLMHERPAYGLSILFNFIAVTVLMKFFLFIYLSVVRLNKF